MYAYASSQLTYLRFRRPPPGTSPAKLHDTPALHASMGERILLFFSRCHWTYSEIPADLFRAIWSFPRVLPDILSSFIPYSLVLLTFGGFIIWNGGIVLGTCAIVLFGGKQGVNDNRRGQGESRTGSPHPANVLLYRVCNLFWVAGTSERISGSP